MNRRKFVASSTVGMLVVTLTIVGLAFYSNIAAKASGQGLPSIINHLPADSHVVFGMNVQAFVNSPVYAQFAQQHEQEIATNLAEITAATGVDPRRDVYFVIGAARQSQLKGAGVVIASGSFDSGKIIAFINSKSKGTPPIPVNYRDRTVLMLPEADGTQLEKGIAFIDNSSEIAIGDLDSLHAVIDVAANSAPGLNANANLITLLAKANPQEMFWFAGDPSSVISKMPTNAPQLPALSAVQSIYGSLNFNASITGKIVVVAKDPTSAGQLGDFARGMIALGNMASGQNPDLAQLLKGVQIVQSDNEVDLTVTLPLDLLTKLQASRGKFGVDSPMRIK